MQHENIKSENVIQGFCTNCFERGNKYMKTHIFELTDDEIDPQQLKEIICEVNDYHIYKCNKCCNNTDGVIYVDEGIIDIIEILYTKGYETQFSCEGHSYKQSAIGIWRDVYNDYELNSHYQSFYISFKANKDKNHYDKLYKYLIENPLCKDWMIMNWGDHIAIYGCSHCEEIDFIVDRQRKIAEEIIMREVFKNVPCVER